MAPKISPIEKYEQDKKTARQVRQDELQMRNYNGAQSFDELWEGLSTEEIKFLRTFNESFIETEKLLNSPQTQTLAASPAEAQALRDSQREVEQNRLFAESRAAAEENARAEKLYDGVEKLADGRYRLTIEHDSGNPEVFYGASQAEVWKSLRDSKKHATAELRRRANSVRITAEMRALTPEIVQYAPLVERVVLTPEQVYKYTQEQHDPVTSVEAIRMLRLGGMTQTEVDRQNEIIVRSRMMEASNIADQWIKETPEFYACSENLQAMIDLMGDEKGMNWACTKRNLQMAFENLKEQGALIERIEEAEAPVIQPSRPRFVPQAEKVPAAAPPVAPRPTAPLKRPTNGTALNGGATSSARLEKYGEVKVQPMTEVEANALSATESKQKYLKDPVYRARLDAYWAKGGR
jgi:hypothetical protein